MEASYNHQEDIAIVGVGFRIPGCEKNLPSELWDNLMNKFSGIRKTTERWSDNYHLSGDINNGNSGLLPLKEWKSFDPSFFGINPTMASTIDPQQRILLKCTWEALEDAGIDPIKLRGSNTSIYVGCSTGDYHDLIKSDGQIETNLFGSVNHSLANRVSYCFDFHGASMTIDSACSSSLNTVLLGCQSINEGKSNLSVAGGVNLVLNTAIPKAFSFLNILSKNGKCMTYDEGADGFVRAEGAGLVVLKKLKDALKDGNNIYCIIKGGNSNVDGNGNTDKANFFQPSKQSQSENIKLALASIKNKGPTEINIDYVETHGTGTPTGDPTEVEGISRVFKDNHSPEDPLLIGSLKSNIGHMEAASGIASLIKCCLMFKNKCFAPNVNFNKINPKIKLNEWNIKIVTDSIPFKKNKKTSMVVNSFGVTGSNCCLVLTEYIEKNKSNQKIKGKEFLIPFSANSNHSLKKYKDEVSKIDESLNFEDFVFKQLSNKSTSLFQRSVIIAKDWAELKNKLFQHSPLKDITSSISIKKSNPITVFVFCGQGSQYNKMGLELYNSDKIFKKSIDTFDKKLSDYYGYSVFSKLRSIDDNDSITIHDPIIAQPATAILQISLFEFYKHWGINPSYIIGHSLGELPMAYCSGMIDFDTVCYLIYHRSMAQSKTNGCGKMLSCNITSEEFIKKYSPNYPSIEIACYNSPNSIVVAGKESLLIELSKEFKKEEIFCAMLGSLSSFHTSSQRVVKDHIYSLNFGSREPLIPTFSTVTTNLFDSNTMYDNDYIFQNIMKPVLFNETVSNLYKHIERKQQGNQIVFIELAPHQTLSFYLKQLIPRDSNYFNSSSISIYSPLHKKKNDLIEIQQTIINCYCNNGYDVDFKSQITIGNQNQLINNKSLPSYQWDDSEFWKESDLQRKLLRGPPMDSLGLLNEKTPVLKSFETQIDVKKTPFQYLKGHMVKGKNYFPGVGYIDNLLKMYPTQDIDISFIEFKAPLVLIDGVSSCLQSNVFQMGKNEFQAQFHFIDQKTTQWVKASFANYQLLNSDYYNPNNKYNIQELISKDCNLTKLSKNQFYDFIKAKAGLSYSGEFQGVEQCFLGNGCSLIEIPFNQSNCYDREDNSINMIPILDSCLHGTHILYIEQCQIVLEKIEGLKYYSSTLYHLKHKEPKLYVFTRIVNKDLISNSISSSIIVMVSDGAVLFEIESAAYKSLIPLKDPMIIENPTNELFSTYLQSMDSPISEPSSFKPIYQKKEFISSGMNDLSRSDYQQFISTLLFSNLIKRNKSIENDLRSGLVIEEMKNKYCTNIKFERLFTFVIETIKQYDGLNGNLNSWSEDNIDIYKTLIKSTRVISKLLFPLEGEDLTIDTPQSLFENNLLDDFYNKNGNTVVQNQLVGEIIKQSIKPLVNEKMVFRILEFGGGVGSLSVITLNKINELLEEFPNYEIDIEYTWTDISTSFIPDAKKLLSYIKGINIIFRSLDLEEPLVEKQLLKPSYYDFVIMSNVLHVIKEVKFGIDEIYKVLSPNGQLLFIETPYRMLICDSIFGAFDQWWGFTDTDIRVDRCCMKQKTWFELLSQSNYQDIIMSDDIRDCCFVIQAKKPSISSSEYKLKLGDDNDENIIVFGENDTFMKCLKIKSNQKEIRIIENYQQFNELVKSKIINNQSIIYFIKTLNQIFIENFKEITLEYIQINQLLLSSVLECKNILVLNQSSGENYLGSSISGAARYFDEFPQLKLYTFDFDKESLLNQSINIIESIIEPVIKSMSNSGIRKELFIRNNKIFFERYKQEKIIKENYKSTSFENEKSLLVQLNSNLEYQLKSKQALLKPNEIEVNIKATGINYKDYLVYTGLTPSELINHKGGPNPEFGHDFSGIITRVGDDQDNQFKVGDQVYGIWFNTMSSHIIVDKKYLCHKPSKLDHVVASSLPVVYVTSLYSLYNIGNIENDESVLIHSASGGIGLSALNILKWKGHKSHIFVTVGSKVKEQYLHDTYGDFITGIFSSRNKDYEKQIKIKLAELGSNKKGVDIILNTLSSSEHMVSNFKCLNHRGRIIDLSITHLNHNEYTCNNNFKYNFGYHNVEILFVKGEIISKLLKEISLAFENETLLTIPIIEFQNSDCLNAIEFINKREHIGKIVVNHNKENFIEELVKKNNLPIIKSNYQINSDYLGKNILVTGQSGIILEILKWIVKYSINVENIIILSKSTLKWELEFLINQNKNKINFIYKSVDVGDSIGLEKIINEVLVENPQIANIDSIFHYAFTQVSCKENEIGKLHLEISHQAKTMGAINLHNQSIKRNWKLINFIMASSAAGLIGSTDQCSYVSSCNVLDSFSKYRKDILGLPSICVNYGLIESTGFVSRNQSVAEMLDGQGIRPIQTNQILGSLDLQIQNPSKSTNIILAGFNFKEFATGNLQQSNVYKFDFHFNSLLSQNKSKQTTNKASEDPVKDLLTNKICELLSIDESKINIDIRLIDYGSDSLTIVQIKNAIDRELLPNLITIQMLQNNTISHNIKLLTTSFNKKKQNEFKNLKTGSFAK
ncbi:hypothetical protein RB653_008592 [Dictyostelium firmibasis]|uniref:Uncharacterized protein n=1 Tax=Dictyostelium firmibasis TaxID=79012 RepID=A0AAN7YWQ1_9MYCE